MPSFEKAFDLILPASPFGIEFIEKNDTSIIMFVDKNYYIFNSKLNLIEKREIGVINGLDGELINLKNKIISGVSNDSSIFNIYNIDKKIMNQHKLDFPIVHRAYFVRYDSRIKNLFIPHPSDKYGLLKNTETNSVSKINLLEKTAPNVLFNDDKLIIGCFNISHSYSLKDIKRYQMWNKKMPPFTMQIVDLNKNKNIAEIIEFERHIELAKLSSDRNKFVCTNYPDEGIVFSMKGIELVSLPNISMDNLEYNPSNTISYINYFDKKSNSVRFFPLDEKEILHRVNIEKEFGEIGQLSKKELKRFGISKYLSN